MYVLAVVVVIWVRRWLDDLDLALSIFISGLYGAVLPVGGFGPLALSDISFFSYGKAGRRGRMAVQKELTKIKRR